MSTKNYQFNNNQTSDGTSVTSNTVNEDKPNSKGGWTKVEDALLKRRDMDSTQKLILSILTRLSVKEGFAWVSVIGLASMIGMTEKATRRAINRLVTAGHLERIERYRKNLQITNQWLVHVQPVRTPRQRHGGDRESEETSISGVSLRSPPDIKETSTGRDVRARTVPSDRTSGSFGDNSQDRAKDVQQSLIGSASAPLSNSAPQIPEGFPENEASVNAQQLLPVVEWFCKGFATLRGVTCYPRSKGINAYRDPGIAEAVSGKLYKRGWRFGDVYYSLTNYFQESESTDPHYYTITAWSLWLDTKVPGLRSKGFIPPAPPSDTPLFEDTLTDDEWNDMRNPNSTIWDCRKVNGHRVRTPKIPFFEERGGYSNLYEYYFDDNGLKQLRRKDDSEALTRS
jgi:hypothetical protein